MNEFTINVVQDPSTIININNLDQATSLQVSEEGPTSLNVQNNSSNVLINPSAVDLSPYVTGEVVRPSETGAFYAASNPSGFITGVDLSAYATTGYVTGASGVLQIQISALNSATGSYVLDSETGIFITQSQTGLFYASNNPSGFITGVDLSTYATITNLAATGSTLQTNINNLSGVYATISNLNSTGSSLDSKINLLSGSSVLLYGDQTISGIKTFTTGVNISGNLTVDTNTLFVDSVNNRVGIGTTTPQSTFMLDVNGQVVIRGDNYLNGSLREFGANAYKLSKAGDSWINGGNVGIGTSSSLIGKLDVAGSLTTTTPSDVLVLSRPYNPGVAFHTAASFRLSNPSTNVNNTRLDIALQQGNSVSPVSPDTTVMTLLGDGRVGIGTTTPAAPLHINTSQNGVAVRIGQDGTVGRLEFGNINVALTRISNQLALQGFDGFTFGTSSGEKMRLTAGGSLGIGTVAPNERLTVSGNANISGNISANNLVYNTGNQTVSGIKNFQSVPLVSGEEVYYKKNVVYFTGNNFTPDANLARTFEYVLTGLAGASATLNAPINMNNGENIVIKIKQSPSGSNNIIFNSNYKFPGGVIPSLTFTPDKADIYTALKIDSNFYSTYIKDFIN